MTTIQHRKISLAFGTVIYNRMALLIFLSVALGACILPTPIESPREDINNNSPIDSTPTVEFAPSISEMSLEEIFENIITAHSSQAYHVIIETREMMARSPYYHQLPAYQSEYSMGVWQDGLGNRRQGRRFGETSLLTETATCYQGKCTSYELTNNIYQTLPDDHFYQEGKNSIPLDTIGHYTFSQIDSFQVKEYRIIEDGVEIAGRSAVGLYISGTGDDIFQEVIYWVDTEKWIILAFDVVDQLMPEAPFRIDEVTLIQYNPELDENFWTDSTYIQPELHCDPSLSEHTVQTAESIQDAQNLVDLGAQTSNQMPQVYELHEVEIYSCLEPAGNTILQTYYETDSTTGFFVGMIQIQQIDYAAPLPDVGIAVQVRGSNGRLIDSRTGEHILIWIEDGQRFMIRGSTEREGTTPELLLDIANSLDSSIAK